MNELNIKDSVEEYEQLLNSLDVTLDKLINLYNDTKDERYRFIIKEYTNTVAKISDIYWRKTEKVYKKSA